MRTFTFFALLCLVLSCSVKSSVTERPTIHTAEFEAFYQDSTNRAKVTGRIINLPLDKAGKKILKFVAVSIHSDLQQEQYPNIDEDGSFQFRLPESYPAQEIYFGVDEDRYFGMLLVRDSIYIEIDYAKLPTSDIQGFSPIEAVQYSGPDAALTEARNRIAFAGLNGGIQQPFMVALGRIMDPKDKMQELDSLMVILRARDEKLAEGLPEKDLLYLRNEREAEYLGLIVRLYLNTDMPAEVRSRYLEFEPLAMSNTTRRFYESFQSSLRAEAYRKVKASPDSTETELGKSFRRNDSLAAILNTELPPLRADLIKLYVQEKDPVLNESILGKCLETTQTSWIREILQERFNVSQYETRKLRQILGEKVAIAFPVEFGRPVGRLDFGADLYKVNEELSGVELLAKIRGAFPDKALYLDFWATWCAPCIAQMPFSAKLHQESEGLPVEYVYLCTDGGGSVEQWQNHIANHEVGGTHLFVPETVHKELMNLFSARGYPTYILLEADGTPKLDVARPGGLNRKLMVELLDKE